MKPIILQDPQSFSNSTTSIVLNLVAMTILGVALCKGVQKMSHEESSSTLKGRVPSFWLKIFKPELPIVGFTVLYWLFFGNHFHMTSFGKEINANDQYTLSMLAGVTLSYVGFFYYEVLKQEHLGLMVMFQRAALISDLVIIILTLLNQGIFASPFIFHTQLSMAVFWTVVRLVFLKSSVKS